jgi:nitroreductase
MIPYALPLRDTEWQLRRAEELLAQVRTRRSCRNFSDRPVDRRVIEAAVRIAHTAPSGANRQPWRFVAISDPALKHRIREAAEVEERNNYQWRMPPEWLEALEPIGTSEQKPYLEIAPWLVVLFRVDWELHNGVRHKSYYPMESVGIAAGFFLIACNAMGLATLTHTPSPMGFLREICGRPENEKPFLLIPVGYPADDAVVPDLPRRPLESILQWDRTQ